MYVISVPISVPVSKKKRFYLNLNQYRNAHHFTLSKAKNVFHDIVKPLLGSLPRMEKIELTYTLYVGNLQLCDTSNICCIVDKFFSDVLVSSDIIEDDNYTIVLSADYRYGGLDKSNPRVEVAIKPVGPAGIQMDESDQAKKEEPMQITIRQPEIELALRAYVTSNVALASGKRIEMEFSAKRGPGGLQAVINIVDDNGEGGQNDQQASSEVASSETTSTASSTGSEAPATTGGKKSNLFGNASRPQNAPESSEAKVAEPA